MCLPFLTQLIMKWSSPFSLEGALEVAAKVGAKHTWLTHLSHQLPKYQELAAELPEGVQAAYDGLTLEF